MEYKKLSKKDLANVLFTKEWIEQNCPAEISNYVKRLFDVLFDPQRKVSGLTKAQKKAIVRTAEFIKSKKDQAFEQASLEKTEQAQAIAENWEQCYTAYLNSVVNSVLNKQEEQTL